MNAKNLAGTVLLACAATLLTPVQAQPLGGTLKKVQDLGTVTLGTRSAFVPFNYLDDDNKQAGYAWEISLRVVEKLKERVGRADLKVRPMEMTPQTRIPLVANQTIDLECSATTHNAERETQVNFSTTFFVVGTRMLTRADAAIADWKDLAKKNVAVGAGTTNERVLRQLNEKENLGINIVLAPDVNEGSMSVESGRAVAYVLDDIGLFASAARARNPAKWKIVGEPLGREAYGCMMRKGDAEFKQFVDGVIVGMMKNGEMAALYEKYFNRPLNVRNGFSMQMPMQPLIRDVFENPSDKAL
ncbi:transporter substrate-binding domain-containing protein [Variovorax sp. UMC13]|uniref:transporter substrate-binding domain-containing protein n=1 Tax=Variovorax sp. UMC13 TaxID=1862326 RepID=UPI001604333C|nr:transporter substrate-binding domain-containing protein [Variovorax sp. UMC13]MBB1600998.1 glutamate/aspartate ABC transporter substrate-binding protein [Variovorax sp. UMC13]